VIHRSLVRPATAVAVALCCTVVPLRAQGWIEPAPPVSGRPVDWNVRRVATTIRATVDGRVARIEVEEQFRNTGRSIAEGTYHYPMAGEAVFQSLSLWMGEQELRGELMDADRARGIYEEIVRRRRDPALVTLAGHQLLRAQVFPIQPGETRRVVLRFTQVLDKQGDALRWRYALGAEERGSARPDIRLTLREPARFGRPFSPTHSVQVSGPNDGTVVVNDDSRGDVELFLPLQSTAPGLSVVSYAPGGEDGYFMLYVTPPEVPDAQRIGRDLTMVVDVSGSMSGPKIEQAKAAMLQMLGTLTARDRFRLISFSSAVHSFSDNFASADARTLERARSWTTALTADGGTNIEGALREALRVNRGDHGENLDVLVFLTDGVPSVGETQPERLAALAAQTSARQRVFTIGIGTDVNTYLLERMAQDGHGAADFVPPNGNVEQTVGNLARKLRAPALMDLRIVTAPGRIVSMEPQRLPDLFAGQELVVFGRYTGSGTGPMVIEGRRDGETVRVSTPVEFAAREDDHQYVSTLWAARRIGALSRTMRLEGATPSRIEEIRALALRHGIVTEYTAYLVQEPVGATPIARRDADRGRMGQAPASASSSAPAPVASAQTGRGAFEVAQTSADYADASTMGAARKVSDRAQSRAETERSASAAQPQRVVGSRRYEQRGTQWTDVGQQSQRVVTIEAFSAAYFALMNALPELRDATQLGDDVLIAGHRVSVRIQRTGQSTMARSDVMQLQKDFRGA
jgi:Ca-activated chloride channel homolog